MNLALNLTHSAALRPDRLALICGETRMSYAELEAAAAAVAARLRELGLREGDAVGLMLPNVPEFAIAYYGILRAGGVVVPMNVLLKQREIAFYLTDPSARLFFAWHECADAARAAAQQAAAECIVVEPGALDPSRPADPPDVMAPKEGDDTAVILYTSSTTGTPKGVTHANLARLPGSIGTPVAGVEMRIVDNERRELAPGEALDLANSAAVVAMPRTPDRFRTTKLRSNP